MKYLSVILLVQLFAGCSDYSDAVKHSLDLAGNNRPELEKVLNHYAGDRQKYQAAEYLIRYMYFCSYQEVLPQFEMVFDSLTQVPVGDNALRESIFNSLMDSVTDKEANLAGIRKYDIQEISSDYLIENIDLAFEAWQEIPKDKRADFPLFCDYILPHRNLNEPLESGTRKYLKEKYNWVPKALSQGKPIKTVIDSVLKEFHYQHHGDVRDYYPTSLSPIRPDVYGFYYGQFDCQSKLSWPRCSESIYSNRTASRSTRRGWRISRMLSFASTSRNLGNVLWCGRLDDEMCFWLYKLRPI